MVLPFEEMSTGNKPNYDDPAQQTQLVLGWWFCSEDRAIQHSQDANDVTTTHDPVTLFLGID